MTLRFGLLLSSLLFTVAAEAQPLRLTPTGEATPTPAPARIAIIIDDIGYSRDNGLRTARLPAAITLAVLPHTPNGVELARIGHNSGKEIMLHTPMPNTQGKAMDKGTLTVDMDQPTFLRTLRKNLAAIPHITGANNHMGSGLTENAQAMQWLMQELKQRNLFFVDSRTSAGSVALSSAIDHNLLSGRRDVFLDNDRNPAKIARQLDRLIELARERGQALAIGHPYPETLDVLEQRLPELRLAGIELVPASHLLQRPSPRSKPPQPTQPLKSIEPPRLLRYPPVVAATNPAPTKPIAAKPAISAKPAANAQLAAKTQLAPMLAMPKLVQPRVIKSPTPLNSVSRIAPATVIPPLAPPMPQSATNKPSKPNKSNKTKATEEAKDNAELTLEPAWDDLSPYIN